MASLIGMAKRNENAQGRINASLATLVTLRGVEIGEYPTVRRDAVLQETLRLEWMADVLEALASTPEPSKPVTKVKGN